MTSEDVFAVRIQVVQGLTVDPDLFEPQTHVKLDPIVKLLVSLRVTVGRRSGLKGGGRISGLVSLSLRTSSAASLQILVFLHEQVRSVLVDGLLNGRCKLRATAFARSREYLRLRCDLHYRLCQLLHLHLDDELLEVPLRAVVLLLDDELALGLSEALDLSLKLIETIDDISLHTSHLLFQVPDQRVHALLR